MVRVPLTPGEVDRGRRLGAVLRAARGDRSMGQVAVAAGISVETLRKIETGRIPTPAFFTIAALADELSLSMDQLAVALAEPQRSAS
ncbi:MULTISPECIES: helix-turn-helix transcriptional regulator [Mycobacteriales]|jgi:transcriptional regulator with XRE-family HTH domain|uniref:Helix-turn-helix transcriptional regulator n=1 Tax=Gordonia rubripertincta TaxID=36822 RepID=A0ABT4MWL7_GORRU|nr:MULTISPECIES: helix-turn-helix transcriptional regulator [Mycobacteriales]MBA4024679.1 phosphoglucosamine mutase [Gordonia sp. (in: high G+C Gram-positive bacteria)]MCZ4550132.1 helix-turn-helix transcriptional regulator [Gordonia rubripertincta]ORM33139.1 transcriptional regulator [Williamsia sp. 1135]OZG30434.1 transcriptional regulator [Williamsia sp. 1138]